MIDKEQAIELAALQLYKMQRQTDIILKLYTDSATHEQGAWVIPFNSLKYYNTGDTKYHLLGNYPIVINDETGEVVSGSEYFRERIRQPADQQECLEQRDDV